MTSFTLRCIALITMIIDHVGYAIFPRLDWMRVVGRIAFPIYCFLLTQGFRHTRSVPKYAMRLALFALISELPFNLVFHNRLLTHNAHNVFFSLLFALGALIAWKQFIQTKPLWALLGALTACVLAVALGSDYSFWGILLCLCFYLAGDSKPDLVLALLGSLLLFTLYRLHTRTATINWAWTQWYCLFSMPFILFYNGKPGYRGGKWAFYALYPAHLFVLWMIKNNIFEKIFNSIF